MDLICYLHPGWAPLIRKAPATRPWMDATSDAFAYRCLPLNIANAHGWEILSPCGFEAIWDGSKSQDAVTIRLLTEVDPARRPVSLFGEGVLTFHVEGLFRTPEGWNLWLGGSPNRMKDGIAALGGIIETDWAPFTFTMNWRFTRPHNWVRFEPMEPIGFFMPIQRAAIESFQPRFERLDKDPATLERFHAWSRARDEFHQALRANPPGKPADHWQKHYYRGVDVAGEALVKDHRTKLRLRDFDAGAAGLPSPPADDAALARAEAAATDGRARQDDSAGLALARREWLLETQERQRSCSRLASAVERRVDLGSEAFLDRYYAPSRPVVLLGAIAGWPALALWTPEELAAKLGAGAAEAATPARAFEVVAGDAGGLDAWLDSTALASAGKLSIGAAGSLTPLHQARANQLIVQAVGRQRVKLVPAAQVGRLAEDGGGFSAIADLDDPTLSFQAHPRLKGLRVYDLELAAGEALFAPVGWWLQARAADLSVSVAFANFRWPNDAAAAYPVADPGDLAA